MDGRKDEYSATSLRHGYQSASLFLKVSIFTRWEVTVDFHSPVLILKVRMYITDGALASRVPFKVRVF